MSTLIMLYGIAGSGKSTWAKKYIETHPFTILISSDAVRKEITGSVSDTSQDYRVWTEIKRRINVSLNKGHDTILDATNLKKRNRDAVINQLPANADVSFKIFDISPEEAKKRIKEDLEKGIDRSRVPEDVIDRMHEDFKQNIQEIRNGYILLEA